MAVFNDILGSRKNQLEVMREQDVPITADQLLAPCDGERTEEGMRANIRGSAVHRSMDLRQRLRADLWPDGRCGDG